MLKGDLTTTPLAPLLVDLANDTATGCLHIIDPADEEALVFFKAGLIYAVSVPGSRPQLGAKLVSSGALAPEALAEALEAQRTELQGWRLGELLVHLGYVDQPVVEAFIKEQVSEALWDLLRWTTGRWKFRKNIKAREDVGPPMVVVDLLEHLRERGYEWETISAVVHGPAAIPKLSTRGDTSAETMLDNDAWSMLCKIDGIRSVSDLASDCGYTLFEAGHVIVSLVQAGLVDIDEVIDAASTELYGATTLSSALSGELDDDSSAVVTEIGVAEHGTDDDAMSRLARMVNEVGGTLDEDSATPAAEATEDEADPALVVPLLQHSSESFAASMARVSNALSDVLGDTPEDTAGDSHAYSMARRSSQSATNDPEWQRRKRLRTAAAEELATAHALIEAEHATGDLTAPLLADGEIPKIVSHETDLRRIAEREAAKAARADGLSAPQASGTDAELADADAIEPESVGAESIDAESVVVDVEGAEAEQIAADVAAAEQAEADRIETERIEAAEAQRIADEQAEADRIEAERIEAERVEAERIEAEAAAADAERVEAERIEAERIEAERIETERLEAERIEAEAAAVEAERAEAERAEAERIEAERIEAERIEAEAAAAEAERAEAERIETEAAAAEAERAEAERIETEAAAAEAERIEAERVEAERVEAERIEAERIAAEESETAADADITDHAEEHPSKSSRSARRKAEKQAAEEAEQAELAAAAASAMLIELAASDDSAAPTVDAISTEEMMSPESEVGSPVDDDEPIVRDEAAAAAATALLLELATSADEPPVATETDEATEVVEEPDEIDDPEPEPVMAGRPWDDAGVADTAALLRELSSLGDDAGPQQQATSTPSAPRAPRPPAAADKKSKKKIGLFGL